MEESGHVNWRPFCLLSLNSAPHGGIRSRWVVRDLDVSVVGITVLTQLI